MSADIDACDLSYQTCYVFNPTNNASNDIDTRPRKKRKTIDAVTDYLANEDLKWPKLCKGSESEACAAYRQRAFTRHWQAAEQRIAAVAAVNIDEPTIDKIREYIRSDARSEQELRTAIIVSGSDKSAFGLCLDRLRASKDGDLVVQLQASQAPTLQAGLKALIRNAIETHSSLQRYDSFIARNKRLIPMNFDLELLQKYVEANSIARIVVAMPDAETFDLNVFSELITNLLSWKDRLPVVLILGLATTVHLFESRLSKATIRRLKAEVFALSSDRDIFFDVVEAVQTRSLNEDSDVTEMEPGLILGPSLVSALASLAEEQSTTIHSFRNATKYAYMTHFFSNSLSALLDPDVFNSNDNDQVLCEAIRNTPSFQAHCTAILDGRIEDLNALTARGMLSSDSTLLQHTQQQLSATYSTLATKQRLFLSIARLAAELSPKTPALKLYYDLLTSHAQSAPLDSDAYAIIESQLPTLPISAFTLVAKLPALQLPSNTLTSPTDLLTHITTLLNNAPSTHTLSDLFLTEAILTTSRAPLASAFNPKPRFAIERALSSPADYLGCECCTSMHATEPTIVLYRLLGEAGREVNVMDLWTTFKGRVMDDGTTEKQVGTAKGKGKGKGKAKANGKGDVEEPEKTPAKGRKRKSKAAEDEPEDAATGEDPEAEELDPERQALAQFYTALAELRYLGLVKSASDRRLNKGVEVVSRVTWHGL
jgi:origin recognition complex subunit 3